MGEGKSVGTTLVPALRQPCRRGLQEPQLLRKVWEGVGAHKCDGGVSKV